MKKGTKPMTQRPLHLALPSARRATQAGLLSTLLWVSTFCPLAQADSELGRLFFTPERRQALDRQRELNIQETQVIPEDPMLTINGIVTRSSGKQTTWINGVAQNENDASGITITTDRKTPGKVIVQPNDRPPRKANVGDTINRNTGETSDLLGDGQIGIRRGREIKAAGN